MKRCVITGAASGIGAALAEMCVGQGYEVIGIDRDETKAAELCNRLGPNCRFILTDLAARAGLEPILADLAATPIHLLIHSAGINAVGAFEKTVLGVQEKVLAVNLRVPLQLTRALLARDLLVRGSSIVFISSLSHFVSYPGAAVYAACKDALTAYARSLSVALKPRGVHVLCVFPGPTRTPHAAAYSPDNSFEHRRMPPEVLAEQVLSALRKKRYRLVPGLSNKLFALMGTWFPALTERVMFQTLFVKLETQKAE